MGVFYGGGRKENVYDSESISRSLVPANTVPHGWSKVPVRRGHSIIRRVFSHLRGAGGYYVCGGFARWACSPNDDAAPAGDVDVFCKDETAYTRVTTILDYQGFKKKHESDIAIEYEPFGWFWQHKIQLQVVKPRKQGKLVAMGTIYDVLGNFDFSVVRIGLTSLTEAVADATFVEDEQKRVLRIREIHCPVGLVGRIAKYAKKGYAISGPETYKLFTDWDGRSADYKAKLGGFVQKANAGDITDNEKNEMYALMRID